MCSDGETDRGTPSRAVSSLICGGDGGGGRSPPPPLNRAFCRKKRKENCLFQWHLTSQGERRKGVLTKFNKNRLIKLNEFPQHCQNRFPPMYFRIRWCGVNCSVQILKISHALNLYYEFYVVKRSPRLGQRWHRESVGHPRDRQSRNHTLICREISPLPTWNLWARQQQSHRKDELLSLPFPLFFLLRLTLRLFRTLLGTAYM